MAGEGPQLALTRTEAEKKTFNDQEVLIGANGKPLTQITCAAAELVPTIQYGNCTIGPVVVKIWVEDGKDINQDTISSLSRQIRQIQSVCEQAIAEDRETVHALTRQSSQGRYQS